MDSIGINNNHDSSSMGCHQFLPKPIEITRIGIPAISSSSMGHLQISPKIIQITKFSTPIINTNNSTTTSNNSIETDLRSSKTIELDNKYPVDPISSSVDRVLMLYKLVEDMQESHPTNGMKGSEFLSNGVHKKRKGKLLVLDLNGILADILTVVPKGYKPDKKFRGKSVFKRPFCDDFLEFCFEKFDVGVWSSRTKKNVDCLVDFLMGDMKHHLLFCWNSFHCTNTGFKTIENRHKPLVLKELKKLWDKQEPELPWENEEYNETNTLLLDDSPYKALRNPPCTAVFPRSYRLYDQNDNSLGPGGDIRVYLEGLAMAQDVQKYVEHHPFGQSQVDHTMGFYRKMICAETCEIHNVVKGASTHLQELDSIPKSRHGW